jgi:hypothetical protein
MSDAHIERNRRRTYVREWRKLVAERAGITYTQDGLEALAKALQCDPGQLLMVDPTNDDAIWSMWDRAKPAQRKMIVKVVAAILSEPLPDEG